MVVFCAQRPPGARARSAGHAGSHGATRGGPPGCRRASTTLSSGLALAVVSGLASGQRLAVVARAPLAARVDRGGIDVGATFTILTRCSTRPLATTHRGGVGRFSLGASDLLAFVVSPPNSEGGCPTNSNTCKGLRQACPELAERGPMMARGREKRVSPAGAGVGLRRRLAAPGRGLRQRRQTAGRSAVG